MATLRAYQAPLRHPPPWGPFPKDSTPNGAANDPTICSGDVLRDLCQIGEALRLKGMGRAQRVERVKRSFTEGVLVRHAEIRELLATVKKNEFEERLKRVKYEADGARKEEGEAMMKDGQVAAISTVSTEGLLSTMSTGSARRNRFERDTPTIYNKEHTEQNDSKPTKLMNPGFATADQIRANFRRHSDTSTLKRKRPTTSFRIKDECPVNHEKNTTLNSTNADLNDFKDDLATNNAKRLKTTPRISDSKLQNEPLPSGHNTESTHRQTHNSTDDIKPRNSNSRVSIGENDSTSQHKSILAPLKGLDDVVGRAQGALKRSDVQSAEGLLVEAQNLIASAFATFDSD